jgi:Uma2 family endonuclease
MALAHNTFMSYNEYINLKETSDKMLEYIDGVVYMSPSPSTKHQRVSGRLNTKLMLYLENKPCEVIQAPYDIELKCDDIHDTKIVIPDLSVICEKKGFTDNKYIGIPDLIIEILSPSNQGHDLVTKFNLYMKYKVKEYWIVNPIKDAVTVYSLNDDGFYEQADIKVDTGIVHSSILTDFEVNLDYIFK